MSASTITIPNTPRTLTSQGLISSGGVAVRNYGADNQQYFTFQQVSGTSGGSFETLGGGGSGLVANRLYATISQFVAGRSYAQWALVASAVNPATYYTKTTAGTQVLTADPSTDAVNWAISTSQPAASLFNGNEIVEQGLFLQGNSPARIEWLAEGLGLAASLTGRPANGTGTNDAQLRVNGGVSAEGLYVFNGTNHLEDPAAGTGLASYEIGKDYFFPGGVPTATTPGAARPVKYGGGVFPAYVPGQSTIYTLASDPTSLVLVSRTGTGGATCGNLSVPLLGKLGPSFLVQSFDATNVLDATDTGTFQWLIVNPAW
jgi:hypothetical protein